MNRFSELLFALEIYKDDIDKIVSQYRKTDAADKQTYSTQTYAERHSQNVESARKKIKSRQLTMIDRANGIIDDIQDALKRWICPPVNDKQLPMLSTLLTSGMKLNGAEIEVLQQNANGNYFAGRLVDELAKHSGVKGIRPQRSVEAYVAALKRVIFATDIFINGYLGQKSPFAKELLPGNVSDHIIYAASACRIFSGESSLLTAALLWDGDEVPVQSAKRTLTNDDRAIMDRMFEGCKTEMHYGAMAQKIVTENPEIKEILQLSEKYSQYLPKEDATGE